MQVQEAHTKLGHCGEDYTRATAQYYGQKLTGKFKPCEDCGIGKAKMGAVNKELVQKSIIPGERWYIDISSVKQESFGGTKFWFGMLDDCTDLFISHRLAAKSHLPDKLVETFQTLKTNHNITPKYDCCDNASENVATEKECISHGINVQFEYTPPGTPQRNGRIERKFATFYGRICSFLATAGIQEDTMKYGLWAECA